MKRRQKPLLRTAARIGAAALLLASLVAACAAVNQIPQNPSTSAPARALYHRKCGSCHAPFPPHSYSDAEWHDVVADMAPEAGLTQDETEQILNWLKENN